MEQKKADDNPTCFARLSKTQCNALSEKKCKSCRFYKHYTDVKGYEKYLPKGFKREVKTNNEMVAS